MNRKLIIFDLDGTLYKLKGGSFRSTDFYKKVLENASAFISLRTGKSLVESDEILQSIIAEYTEEISIAIEKKFSIDRREYFDAVWNIPAKGYIDQAPGLRDLLGRLAFDYDFVLISDGPGVWVNNVLEELGVKDIFAGKTFTGDGDIRKVFGNAFEKIVEKFALDPSACISVGDQEATDILPAKKLGITTVIVGKKSVEADFEIKEIAEIENVLLKIENEDFLRKFLLEKGIDSSVKKLSGSSSSSTFLVGEKIFKCGPSEEIEREIKLIERFSNLPERVFPLVEIVAKDGKRSIMEMENFGAENFDQFILKLADAADREAYLRRIERINANVLKNIRLMAATAVDDAADSERFYDELISALALNLAKAGLADTRHFGGGRLTGVVSTLCHRDLSVGNIIVRGESAGFIDPRVAVPYLENSDCRGNVCVDIAGYYVSVLRKELELRKIDSSISLQSVISEIETEIKRYEDEKVFSEDWKDLCLAVWYSVYAACKCDYCTAPERLWLYEEMVRRVGQQPTFARSEATKQSH